MNIAWENCIHWTHIFMAMFYLIWALPRSTLFPFVLNFCARPGLSALASHPAFSFGLKQMPPSLTQGFVDFKFP
jgi:hypothetical protein